MIWIKICYKTLSAISGCMLNLYSVFDFGAVFFSVLTVGMERRLSESKLLTRLTDLERVDVDLRRQPIL